MLRASQTLAINITIAWWIKAIAHRIHSSHTLAHLSQYCWNQCKINPLYIKLVRKCVLCCVFLSILSSEIRCEATNSLAFGDCFLPVIDTHKPFVYAFNSINMYLLASKMVRYTQLTAKNGLSIEFRFFFSLYKIKIIYKIVERKKMRLERNTVILWSIKNGKNKNKKAKVCAIETEKHNRRKRWSGRDRECQIKLNALVSFICFCMMVIQPRLRL